MSELVGNSASHQSRLVFAFFVSALTHHCDSPLVDYAVGHALATCVNQ